jgi:hypothetical protein
MVLPGNEYKDIKKKRQVEVRLKFLVKRKDFKFTL